MKQTTRTWALRFALICLPLLTCPLAARDWSDLDEPEVYGSDAEGKFTNLLFARIEDWTNEKGQQRQGFHFLWLLRATWYPKYNSYTFFPLFYRRNSKVDDRRQTITPIFYRKYEDEKNDFILAPLFYYNLDRGDATTVVATAYSTRNVDGAGETTYHNKGLFPLFHYGWERNGSDAERSLLLYPLLSYFEWSQDRTLHVAPLYYRHVREWKEGTVEARSSKTFAILSYYKRTVTAEWEDRTWWLLPFLYTEIGRSTERAGEARSASFFHLAPVFYYESETASAKNREWGETTVMFPSLPLLFYRYHKTEASGEDEQSTWYFFPVYHNSTRRGEMLSSRWVTPLFARKTDNDSTSMWIFPFFYTSSRASEGSSSVSLLPFFKYYNREATDASEGASSLWVIPFYKWRNDDSKGSTLLPLYWYETGKKKDFAMFTPLFWRSENHETRELTLLGIPFFYFHRWAGEKQEQSTLWALNYYEWNHADSEGRLVLPFKYHYSDRLKEYDLYILAAFSTSQSIPELNDGGLYLDSDYSFGYNIFSISWRVPILSRDMLKGIFRRGSAPESKPTAQATADTKKRTDPGPLAIATTPQSSTATPPTETGPSVARGKDIDPWDRSNTKSYLGWSFLFGWISSIHADSKRHFRILPLMWLSWDEVDENDKLTYWPFAYLDYRNGDERYHAIFPIFLPVYGRYSKGETFVEDWGAILYIASYDAETKEAETSVLWPFFKKYSSPVERGVRLFPLFANRTWQDGSVEHNRWIAPLFYSITDRRRDADEERTESLTLSPLYLASSSSYTTGLHAEPAPAPEKKGRPLADVPSSKGSTATPSSGQGTVSHRSSWAYLPVPLLYLGREDERTNWNLAFLFGGSGSDDDRSASFYALPLFYRSREATPAGDRTNLWIVNLYHHTKDPSINYASTDIIWPFFQVWHSADEHGWNLFPLFAWKAGETGGESHTTHFSPVHYFRSSTSTQPNHPELTTTSTTRWLLPYYGETYTSSDMIETDHWFPLPFGRRHQKIVGRSSGCRTVTTEWRFYPIFYRGTDEHQDTAEQRCPGRDESYTFVIPLLFHWSKGNTSTDFILGYYRDSGPDHGYHNLLFLAEYEYYPKSFDAALLFKAIRLESNERSTHFRALWGLLADWESFSPDADPRGYRGGYDFRFLNYIQRNNSRDYGSEFKTAFWPVYSYYSDENETSFWFLPTLSYHQRKKDYRFDVTLAGLGWYREYEDAANHGTNLVLGGLVYYRDTKTDHEFESSGSLWGFLWNSESEHATGYKKLTVLGGFIFKKVEHPAGNRRYAKILFGIPLYDEPLSGNDSYIPMPEEEARSAQLADRSGADRDAGKVAGGDLPNAVLLPHAMRPAVAGDMAMAERVVDQTGSSSPAMGRF